MFELAAQQLDAPIDGMILHNKHAVAGSKSISIAELARISRLAGGGLIAHGTAISPPPPYDPTRTENHPLPAWNSPSYHAHAVDLSVDQVTGKVTINRMWWPRMWVLRSIRLYRRIDRRRRGAGYRHLAFRQFQFAYGANSFERHVAAARSAGHIVKIVNDLRLTFDVDQPQDYQHWLEAIPRTSRRS